MDHEPSQSDFFAHVAQHQLTIEMDQGLFRHLTFKNPETFNRHFHLTTWPAYLAISGDMGCFVFTRTSDMFSFFRTRPDRDPDFGYWAEKVEAVERSNGLREFTMRRYLAAINEAFEGWEFEDEVVKARARDALTRSGVLDHQDTDHQAITTAMDYVCPVTKNRFTDFWDHTLTEYTYRFIWCCRAIAWGIAQYDAAKLPRGDSPSDRSSLGAAGAATEGAA